jgi:predicted DsbA family dithiol-disulfide isomerase
MLISADGTSKKVIDYLKWKTSNNPNLSIKNMYVKKTKKIDSKWTAYIIKINAFFRGKEVSFGEVLFSDGKYISTDFIDIEKKESLKEALTSLFEDKFYDDNNLISGTSKSKHKIAVFSDPLCPYCTVLMPGLIKHAKKYPKQIALYYYHFPLESIHPTAPIISKAMIVAHNRNIKNYALKIYSTKISSKLNEKDTLAEVNKALGLKGSKKITKKDINSPKVLKYHKKDLDIASELLLNGTPVVFIDGVKDNSRKKYMELGN